MDKEKSHWRNQLKVPYLAGDELTKEIAVTIVKFQQEEMYSQEKRQKESKTIIYFAEIEKGLVLTKRKAKQISKALKSPYMNDWINKKIIIYAALEKHFGETMPVINVGLKTPESSSKNILNDNEFKGLINQLLSYGISLKSAQQKFKGYVFTDKQKEQIKAAGTITDIRLTEIVNIVIAEKKELAYFEFHLDEVQMETLKNAVADNTMNNEK